MDLNPLFIALLLVTGVAAGIINALAGGGSNLTIPALMVLGLPADVANATNRVAVLLQSAAGVAEFHRHGKVDDTDLGPILVPSLLGGLSGAGLAVVLPEAVLKPVLLATLVGMSVLMLMRPDTIALPPGTIPKRLNGNPGARLALFSAGVYGGFVQAGVGFVLIAVLSGTLHYDFIRANALKMLIAGMFAGVALLVFIFADLVLWLPGLILGLSTMLGALIGVRVALRVSQRALKWFLLIMTLCACSAALLG